MTLTSYRHGGDIFGFDAARRNQIMDFSININPVGLSPLGRKAIKRDWEVETVRYPDAESRDLIKALSDAYHVRQEYISVGNGATELMYTLLRILKPGRVFVPAPSFSEYRLSSEAAGCEVKCFFLDNDKQFRIPVEVIKSELIPHSLVYLGHPNNPDGCLLSAEDFHEIMKITAQKDSMVVIDESFIDFLEEEVSYRKYCEEYDNLVVIMSLTKFYAVPGLRIGCAFCNEFLTAQIKSNLIPWNVNGLAQLYMTHAVKDRDYIQESKKFCKEQRETLSSALKNFNKLHVYPSTVNFILLKLTGKIQDAKQLQDLLMPFNILIRQCANYEGLDASYFRLAVRTEEENKKLLTALRKVWKK